MITFKQDLSDSFETQPIETWRLCSGLSGESYPTIRDSNGDWFAIQTHGIAEDGAVFPSVVCTYPGCTFHEFIKLDGWTDVAEPKQH